MIQNIKNKLIIGASSLLALATCTGRAFAYNRTSPINTSPLPTFDLTLYNNTSNDIFGSGDFANMSIDNFINDTFTPFMQTWGAFFWAGLFGLAALMMFNRQNSGLVPSLLVIIAGVPIIWYELPGIVAQTAGTIVILVMATLLYAFRKKR